MTEQFFMRDDIIEFNSKLDSQCFNVKAYRKRKSKSKKISALAATTTDLGFSHQNILRVNKSMDRTQFTIDKMSQKRNSMTAAIKQRGDLSDNLRNYNKSLNMRSQINSNKKQDTQEIKTAKINYSSAENQLNVNLIGQQTQRAMMNFQNKNKPSQSIKNKYQELQKKIHKNGPVNDRTIQNWLNQILIQYCNQQHFDKSIQNAALKKMSLDRNSLLSQGIKPQYVNRVYKSMFVYSIGFNNLLKELSGKNTHLKKTIWKVYAILLQFCSQGTFETMIGQIERDKANKIESLRDQIQKRQSIIENNDEINQQKNGKIFKELKLLREQNTNLESEKNVLMEDFKEAQQSFNQQVSLRLKFQNKINEIHGIHHQLSVKHQRLYEDYHKKAQEMQTLQAKYKDVTDNYLITKEKLSRTLQDLAEEKRNNQTSNQMINKYQQMRTRFQNSEIQLKNSKDDLLNIIKEKSRKISQLQIELQNSEIMLNLSKSSSKQLQSQYRQSLEDNRKLHGTIRDQINDLNELFTQKKNFNQKHMSYVAQIQFLKNKDSQNKINLDKFRNQLKQQRQFNDDLLLQKSTLQKKVSTFQKDLKDCYDNIEQMKRTKNIYQEELIYLKKRGNSHGEVIRQKDDLLHALTKSHQKLTKENQSLITLNKSLDSKTTVLTQRLRSEQQINKKKYDKLKQQRDQLFKENSQHNAILNEKQIELQKYMSLYDKQMLNLKNQRFQRVNLDLRYKQSLQVMESENDYIKKLNIIISENHEQIQQWKRKYRNFQYIMKQKEHLFEVQRNQLKMYLQDLRKEVMKKKMYMNPMIVQDLRCLLKRSIQKYEKLQSLYKQKIKQFKLKQDQLNTQIKRQKSQNQSQLKQQEAKSKKMLQEKQYQLQFQKQKCKHLQEKVQSLQKILNQNKSSEGVNNLNNLKQKERKYLNTIKQKSEQIEKLLKQIQSAHDHNNTLIKRISQIEDIIGLKNNQITQLEKRITKLSQDYESLERQKIVNVNRQKETLSSKMDDYDDNLLAVMSNNENVLTPSFQRENSRRNRSNSRQESGKQKKKLSSKQETQSKQEQTGNEFGNQLKDQKGKQKGDRVVNPVWRNDFSKKLKNAFTYYQK